MVLDTHVVLSALIFGAGRTAALRTLWRTGGFVPLASAPTITELMRVFAYPKFRLSAAEQKELLAEFLPYCTVVTIPARLPKLPLCRDPHDQMFIELAAGGKARFLVTGDQDLLVLSSSFDDRIVTVEQFMQTLAAR